MNRMLIVLPSGADTTRSMRTLNPADGATVSSSKASSMAVNAAACCLPDSLLVAASKSSRLATSPVVVKKSTLPNMALIRGSMRGSSASFEAMALYSWVLLLVESQRTSFNDALLRALAGQDRLGNFDDVVWGKAQLTHHDFTRRRSTEAVQPDDRAVEAHVALPSQLGARLNTDAGFHVGRKNRVLV